MNTSSQLYNAVRWILGLYFILQGCIQTDLIGEMFFPNIHNVFVVNYQNYVNTIPWQQLGLKGDANIFRIVIGYFILLCGAFFVFNKSVKFFSFLMMLVGIWSVYAHVSCNDPTYMAISGGLIAFLMLCMVVTPKPETEPSEKEKSE